MLRKKCHVMDERLRFVARLLKGPATAHSYRSLNADDKVGSFPSIHLGPVEGEIHAVAGT